MKYKKHLKNFMLDHLWIIIIFIVGPIGFFGIYSSLNGYGLRDFLYYVFIDSFLLLSAMGWRLYSTWDLYELFQRDSAQMDDYCITHPKSNEEREYQLLLRHLRLMHKTEYNRLVEEKKNQKLMMYQWVHQMKTPLSVMRLLAENHQSEEDFRKVLVGVSQIQYNLDQILNVYKLDAMENNFVTERVDLYALCKQSVNDLKQYFIEHQVYPRLELDKELYVYSDPKWLQLILHQILTNAVKYSPRNARVILQNENEGQKVKINIIDEGCGIKASDVSRIFDLFFVGENGRQSGESSGIGLYMVKKIITFLGHEIRVETKEGIGTTFSIIIG